MLTKRQNPHWLSHWERVSLAGGIAFATLQLLMMVVFATFVLPKLGEVGAPAAEKAAAYVANADLLQWGNYLLVLPMPFLLLFLGGLYSVLARVEDGRALSSASALAGAATAMLWPLAAVLCNIAIGIARSGGDAGTIAALDAIGPYALSLTALGRVVLLMGTGAVLLRSGILPPWIAWSGIATAALNLIGSATLGNGMLFPVLAFGTLLFELWLIAFCAALLRSRRSSAVAETPSGVRLDSYSLPTLSHPV